MKRNEDMRLEASERASEACEANKMSRHAGGQAAIFGAKKAPHT